MRERNKEDADRLDRSASSLFPPFYVNQLVERDDQPNSSGVLTERLYVEQDTNYDVVALTDTSGDVVQEYQYDAYGVPTVFDGSPSGSPISEDNYGMQYLFQGGRYDVVTGFYHFGARDYDPVNEVWLQQDPAGYPNGANRYEMEGDDPTTKVDPTGFATVDGPSDGYFWYVFGGGSDAVLGDASMAQLEATPGFKSYEAQQQAAALAAALQNFDCCKGELWYHYNSTSFQRVPTGFSPTHWMRDGRCITGQPQHRQT